MTPEEREAFLRDITIVAVRTDAIVYHEYDESGAIQYSLYPRRKLPLEYAVLPRRPRGRRRGA